MADFKPGQTGNWESVSTWRNPDGSAASRVPGKGDRMVHGDVDGITITVTTAVEIGQSLSNSVEASDSDNTGLAINLRYNNILKVAAGATLRIRGSVQQRGGGSNTIDLVGFWANGGTIIFDSGEAPDPANTHYFLRTSTDGWGFRQVKIDNGGVLTSAPAGGNAYLKPGENTNNGTAVFITDRATVSRFGYAGQPWAYLGGEGGGWYFILQDAVVDGCGKIAPQVIRSVRGWDKTSIKNTTFLNGTDALDLEWASFQDGYKEAAYTCEWDNVTFTRGVKATFRKGLSVRNVRFLGGVLNPSTGTLSLESIHSVPCEQWDDTFWAGAKDEDYNFQALTSNREYILFNNRARMTDGVENNHTYFNAVGLGSTGAPDLAIFNRPVIERRESQTQDGEYVVSTQTSQNMTWRVKEGVFTPYRNGDAANSWTETHGDGRWFRVELDHCAGPLRRGAHIGHSGNDGATQSTISITNSCMWTTNRMPADTTVPAGGIPEGPLLTYQTIVQIYDRCQPKDFHTNMVGGPGGLPTNGRYGPGYHALTTQALLDAQGPFGQYDQFVDPYPGRALTDAPRLDLWAKSIGILPAETDPVVRETRAIRAFAAQNLGPGVHPAYPSGHPDYIAGATAAAAYKWVWEGYRSTNPAAAGAGRDPVTKALNGTDIGIPLAAATIPSASGTIKLRGISSGLVTGLSNARGIITSTPGSTTASELLRVTPTEMLFDQPTQGAQS